MDRYIVDRITEEIAVCEAHDRRMISFPLDEMPPGLREGDILLETDGVFTIDHQETARRRKAVSERLRRLMDRNKENGL